MNSFLEKLSSVEERYKDLEEKLSSPEIIKDKEKYQKYSKELSDLKELVSKYRKYREIIKDLKEAKELEITELISELEEKEGKLKKELEALLLPQDPFDQKNIFVEIRAGTGGEEAALFAADLLRMYARYAEKKGWKAEIVSQNPTGLGGFKEIILGIKGKGAYSRFKYESGTHRVQRIPVTEAAGRIHTSASTVAVLSEAEEVDVKIDEKDLKIDTFRSSGPGGQHMQKTESAVRITHIPTGVVVACQDERSQHQNKAKAMRLLRARVFELTEAKRKDEIAQARRIQIGTGDRSEKIRTYNFPQNRITDHRIGLSIHNLTSFLEGNLDELIEALMTADRLKKIEKLK